MDEIRRQTAAERWKLLRTCLIICGINAPEKKFKLGEHYSTSEMLSFGGLDAFVKN